MNMLYSSKFVSSSATLQGPLRAGGRMALPSPTEWDCDVAMALRVSLSDDLVQLIGHQLSVRHTLDLFCFPDPTMITSRHKSC